MIVLMIQCPKAFLMRASQISTGRMVAVLMRHSSIRVKCLCCACTHRTLFRLKLQLGMSSNVRLYVLTVLGMCCMASSTSTHISWYAGQPHAIAAHLLQVEDGSHPLVVCQCGDLTGAARLGAHQQVVCNLMEVQAPCRLFMIDSA